MCHSVVLLLYSTMYNYDFDYSVAFPPFPIAATVAFVVVRFASALPLSAFVAGS